MKKLFTSFLIILMLTGITIVISAQETDYEIIDGVFNKDEYDNTLYVEQLEMDIGWSIMDENLIFAVKGVGKGWIAAGFNPSIMMKDANIIIGEVSADGTVKIEDHFGVSNTGHRRDEERNILQAAGSENEEGTVLEFVIPLDSGDDMDQPLEPGNEYKVILAYHMSSSNLKLIHSKRGSVTLEL